MLYVVCGTKMKMIPYLTLDLNLALRLLGGWIQTRRPKVLKVAKLSFLPVARKIPEEVQRVGVRALEKQT